MSAHAFDGCGGFGGEVFAVFAPRPDGTLALVAEPPALRPSGALLLDGAPAFFGTQSWSDFGTGVQIVPLKGDGAQNRGPLPRLSLLICYRAAGMRVGNLTIEPDVLLAPMAAVTDLPFRTVLRGARRRPHDHRVPVGARARRGRQEDASTR